MKTLKIKIIEYGNRDLRPAIGVLSVIFKKYVGIETDFTIEKKELNNPQWYKDREGIYYLSRNWIEKNIADEEYDLSVGSFTDDQWRNNERKNSIGGTAEASPINGRGVFYMTATEGQKKTLGDKKYSEWIVRFVHEFCHVAFDDFMERPDLDSTHFWSRRDELLGALNQIDLSSYTTVIGKKRQLQLRVIKLAKKLIELLLQKTFGAGISPAETPIEPRTSLEMLAEAIKEFEGWYPHSRSYRNNNPGNLRWSKYQDGSRNGFSFFNSYKTGWKALLYQLRIAADGRSSVYTPDMTLTTFFETYAPSSDNNHPEEYARFVADQLGVTVDTQISNFIS